MEKFGNQFLKIFVKKKTLENILYLENLSVFYDQLKKLTPFVAFLFGNVNCTGFRTKVRDAGPFLIDV